MNSSTQDLLREIFSRLSAFFGPQRWWPAETPFEVILGAILTQNTAWKNVTAAIANLRSHGVLSFEEIGMLDLQKLALLVRPSGFYNEKAKKIKNFCNHIVTNWGGNLEEFLSQELGSLRSSLLSIKGIGPETADSIILYAAFKPSFVVDTYTYRVFSRHGWVEDPISYEDLREYFMGGLDTDVSIFQEFHALLVRTGNLYCRKKPVCQSCPLNVYF